MHPLGPSTHVSAMANFKGTHTLMHVFEKVEKGKIMKLLDNISEMISNFEYDYYTRNLKMRLGGKC